MMPDSSYEEPNVIITSAVAINVFDGTQSVSTDAPPRPSQSTKVTSAPSCPATSAALYPPGPPPMNTVRVTCSIVPYPHARLPPGGSSAHSATNPPPHERFHPSPLPSDLSRSTPRTPATSTRG